MNFLMQFQSDLLNLPVELAKLNETTALGAAFLAGLATGFWKDAQELSNLRESQKQYEPKMEIAKRDQLYKGWKKAVEATRIFKLSDEEVE